MGDEKQITTAGYLGRLFLAYLSATGLLVLVYLVPLIWGGGKFMESVKDIPLVNVFGGILAVVMVPIGAVLLALYTSFLFVPHGLILLVWMGLRQRGPTVRTPITDMLVSGGLMYGFAFLALDARQGADFWCWYGLISGAAVGGLIGLVSFKLSKARQASLRLGAKA